MAVIIINGKRIEAQGTNVSIQNDKVYVDGKLVSDGLSGTVRIEWEGPLASLNADGPVTCRDVQGSVDAGGPVTCGNVGGNVDAGGPVMCGNVGGDVDAGGPVSYRR